MSDVKNFLRDVGYFGVGAAAVIVETGDKIIKALVRKGEKTLRENQDTVDEIKRKARDAGEKIIDAAQKAVATPESAQVDDSAPMNNSTTVDGSAMSAEEQAELRRQLDEADAAEPHPTAPDAIYHAEEPAPVEESEESKEEKKPEDSANG